MEVKFIIKAYLPGFAPTVALPITMDAASAGAGAALASLLGSQDGVNSFAPVFISI